MAFENNLVSALRTAIRPGDGERVAERRFAPAVEPLADRGRIGRSDELRRRLDGLLQSHRFGARQAEPSDETGDIAYLRRQYGGETADRRGLEAELGLDPGDPVEPVERVGPGGDAAQNVRLVHQAKRVAQIGNGQHPAKLRPDPLARETREARREIATGRHGRRVGHALPVPRVEAEEAEQPQDILFQPFARRADEAHAAGPEIVEPARRIVESAVRVEVERVDGEVAPRGVAPPVVGERDRRAAPVGLDVAA